MITNNKLGQDLMLTSIFLFFFVLKKNKLTIGISALMLAFLLISPFSSMMIPSNDMQREMTSPANIIKSSVADDIFEILTTNKDSDVMKIASEDAKTFNNMVNSDSTFPGSESFNKALSAFGILNVDDIKLIFKTYSEGKEYNFEASDTFKNTWLYKINNSDLDSFNSDSKNFNKSALSKATPTNEVVKFTMSQLKQVVNKINNKFNDAGLVKLNNYILQYTKYVIKYDLNENGFGGIVPLNREISSSYIEDAYKFANLQKLNTSIGLMIWNRMVVDFISNSLTYKFEGNTTGKIITRIENYFFPLLMTSSTIQTPNGALNKYHYLFSINNQISSSARESYNNGSRWENESHNLNSLDIKKLRDTPSYSRIYSKAGYEVFLTVIAVGILIMNYAIFFKRETI
jgi:hypothetical protein